MTFATRKSLLMQGSCIKLEPYWSLRCEAEASNVQKALTALAESEAKHRFEWQGWALACLSFGLMSGITCLAACVSKYHIWTNNNQCQARGQVDPAATKRESPESFQQGVVAHSSSLALEFALYIHCQPRNLLA